MGTLRRKFHRYVDHFGRSRPNGIRRVFKGKRAHDGRPLPLNLQVRPQRAVPTFHSHRNSGCRMPWFGAYDETLDKLSRGVRVPGLLKATAKSNKKNRIYFTIDLIRKNKTRVIYKINKNDSVVAFGIYEALMKFHNRTNLGLYPVC